MHRPLVILRYAYTPLHFRPMVLKLFSLVAHVSSAARRIRTSKKKRGLFLKREITSHRYRILFSSLRGKEDLPRAKRFRKRNEEISKKCRIVLDLRDKRVQICKGRTL